MNLPAIIASCTFRNFSAEHQELIEKTRMKCEGKKTWTVCLSILLIAGVLSAVIYFVREIQEVGDKKQRLTLENYQLQEQELDANWMYSKWGEDNKILSLLSQSPGSQILAYDPETQETFHVLSTSASNIKLIFYSTSDPAIFSSENKILHAFSSSDIQDMVFVPENSNYLVLVKHNDLYLYHHPSDNLLRLTQTGKESVIFNGVGDWVYSAEMWQLQHLHILPPHPQQPYTTLVLYVHTNDSGVDMDHILNYTIDKPYLSTRKLPYPMVGRPLPVVTLCAMSLNLDSQRIMKEFIVDPPKELKGEEWILSSISLDAEGSQSFIVQWTNRAQNQVYFSQHMYNYRLDTLESNQMVVAEKSQSWIETIPSLAIKNGFFRIFPHNNHYHVSFINMTTGAVIQITIGTNWDVTYLIGYDSANGWLYYQATPLDEPSERHVYRTSLDGKRQCLSCPLIHWMKDEPCFYFNAKISPNKMWLKVDCQGPEAEWFVILNLKLLESARRSQREEDFDRLIQSTTFSPEYAVENHKNKTEIFEKYYSPTTKFFRIPLQSYNDLRMKVVLPINYKVGQSYPLILRTYAGPAVQLVNQKYEIEDDLYRILSSTYDVIIASVDGRGTPMNGVDFEKSVFRQLGGNAQLEDQMAAVNYLLNHGYVKPDQIGVSGWSFGGYMTLRLMLHYPSIFKCGASVAPVTDWTLYDALYTERYMGLPSNESNYANTSVLEDFKRTQKIGKFILIHGLEDDNVHIQNSLYLIQSLQAADIDFEMVIAPKASHSLRNVYGTIVRKRFNYLIQCLNLRPQ